MQRRQAKCGAKTRKDGPCQDIAMPNGRCKKHGGKAEGAINPLKGDASPTNKFGIYGAYVREDEQDLDFALGTVDAELRMIRIRLKRTFEARMTWEADLAAKRVAMKADENGNMVLVEHVEDESVTKDGDVVPTERKTFRLPDFDKIEQACLARIESLEKTRKELMKDGGGDPNDPAGSRDNVRFTGGLGGEDDDLPSPFE